jgi:hypothetical protein
MFNNSKRQISQLRKLDDMFREWTPPKAYELRITRDES